MGNQKKKFPKKIEIQTHCIHKLLEENGLSERQQKTTIIIILIIIDYNIIDNLQHCSDNQLPQSNVSKKKKEIGNFFHNFYVEKRPTTNCQSNIHPHNS